MLPSKQKIDKITPAIHGGIDYAELERVGIPAKDVIDFSVSTNPFGPPPGINEAIAKAAIDLYPDSEATELRGLLAKKLNISIDNILAGSGSTELLRLIATAYFNPGDTVIIPQPTYGEYEVASQIAHTRVLRTSMPGESDLFHWDVAKMIELIRETQPRGIFLCNPNNPTGQYLSRAEVMAVLSASGDGIVILDEAYSAFTEEAWSSLDLIGKGNLVIVRSMTKDYALAGLRLGYAVAPEAIISVLKQVKPPWNVSSVAQAAGVFALNAEDYLATCMLMIKEAKDFLVKGLESLGFSPLPSQANFFLIKVGDAARFRQALLRKGILVRDCTSFGLPGYARIAPRSIADCRKLLTAIKESEVCGDAS